jgi:putative heme-binding domain-containing protein
VGATHEDQLYYIFHLRTLKTGWTPADRQAYFSWFNRPRGSDKHPAELNKWFEDVGRSYSDGASYVKFMANIKKDAVDNLTEAERTDLAKYISGEAVTLAPVVQRTVVKEWTMAELVPQLEQLGRGRSYEKGRAAYTIAQCAACHRLGNEGGAVGPDITGAASRFNARDLLETIIEPSKVISDQYQNIVVRKKDDDDVIGRLMEEDDAKMVLRPNPLTEETVTVKKSEVKSREASKLSPMPEGLANILTRDEILDLLAYIQAGGKRDHAAFR